MSAVDATSPLPEKSGLNSGTARPPIFCWIEGGTMLVRAYNSLDEDASRGDQKGKTRELHQNTTK